MRVHTYQIFSLYPNYTPPAAYLPPVPAPPIDILSPDPAPLPIPDPSTSLEIPPNPAPSTYPLDPLL